MKDKNYSLGVVEQQNQKYVSVHDMTKGALPLIAVFVNQDGKLLVQVPQKDNPNRPSYLALEDVIKMVQEKGQESQNIKCPCCDD